MQRFIYEKANFFLMVDLKDKELNKELKKLKSEDIPEMDEIKKENDALEKKERSFLKKFFIRKRKN